MKQHFFQTVRNHTAVSWQFFCTLITVFPATPIQSIEKRATHWKLTLNLLGLTGVNAVLKQQVITDLLPSTQLQQLHQWYYERLYQSWGLYHWPVQSEKKASPLYENFLAYCQTNPRNFPISYADWGFCYPSLRQLHQRLQQKFPGIHRLKSTVGWVPMMCSQEPRRLGSNTILGQSIPLSKCGLLIHSVVEQWDHTVHTKAILLTYFAPWPKLWGIPILKVHWSIQSIHAPSSLPLSQGKLGNAGLHSKPEIQSTHFSQCSHKFEYEFTI